MMACRLIATNRPKPTGTVVISAKTEVCCRFKASALRGCDFIQRQRRKLVNTQGNGARNGRFSSTADRQDAQVEAKKVSHIDMVTGSLYGPCLLAWFKRRSAR